MTPVTNKLPKKRVPLMLARIRGRHSVIAPSASVPPNEPISSNNRGPVGFRTAADNVDAITAIQVAAHFHIVLDSAEPF